MSLPGSEGAAGRASAEAAKASAAGVAAAAGAAGTVAAAGADRAASAAASAADAAPVPLELPLDRAVLSGLHAGDACLLSGALYTLRDAGHLRLLEEMDARGTDELPYGLAGQTIFYAGPTPAAAGRPFGAIGPTTASRMDFAAPRLYRAGIAATLGKGARSDEVRAACRETGSVYFIAVGGAAAYLAKCVVSEQVVAYPDLGTEALRRIEVKDFPVFVCIDVTGACVYDEVGHA